MGPGGPESSAHYLLIRPPASSGCARCRPSPRIGSDGKSLPRAGYSGPTASPRPSSILPIATGRRSPSNGLLGLGSPVTPDNNTTAMTVTVPAADVAVGREGGVEL